MDHMIKAYGDRLGDGKVQLSFTLPVDKSEEAKEAAREMALSMNLEDPMVVSMESMGKGYTMFVVYAKCKTEINYSNIKAIKVEVNALSMYECDALIKSKIKRKLVIVGACTGYDAHTVGIDAILNMKGYNGEYGLERYQQLSVHNLGAQVLNKDLIEKSIKLKADAILISKVVTQQDIHIRDLTDFIKLFEETKWPQGKPILLVGGPRVNHALAVELGYDAGFGPGTTPNIVGTYVIKKYFENHGIKE
jgi:beta-lysine 5,6-aminomutase beta subunit